MKNGKVLFGIMCFIFCLPFIGITLLTQIAYNSTGCEQFNIDNIEVRTGIDIPPVTDNINCNSDGHIKMASFVIKEEVDIRDYIQKNDFIKSENSYENKGENETSKWNATLNLEARKLSVQLIYKEAI